MDGIRVGAFLHYRWLLVCSVLFLICSLAAAAGPAELRPSVPSSSKTTFVRLLFCGDYMLHKGVKRTAMYHRRAGAGGRTLNNHGFDVPLASLRHLTAQSDCSFCNLECPLVVPTAGDPYCLKTKGAYWFKAPPAAAHALRRAGFTVASIANNHMDNAEAAGVLSTISIMNQAGIVAVGGGATFDEAHAPKVVTVKGLRIAFLAYCSERLGRNINSKNPATAHVCRHDPFGGQHEQLWHDISVARQQAEITVLSFHWGPKEYTYQPDSALVPFAKACTERGVDIIVGHHPHVLHKLERHDTKDGRRCLIMYSLGNLVSNQSPRYVRHDPSRSEDKARRREGAAIAVTISREQRAGTKPSIPRIVRVDVHPLWTDNNWHDYRTGREPARVQVVSIAREIAELEGRLAFLRKRARRIKSALRGELEKPRVETAQPASAAAPPSAAPLPGPP